MRGGGCWGWGGRRWGDGPRGGWPGGDRRRRGSLLEGSRREGQPCTVKDDFPVSENHREDASRLAGNLRPLPHPGPARPERIVKGRPLPWLSLVPASSSWEFRQDRTSSQAPPGRNNSAAKI